VQLVARVVNRAAHRAEFLRENAGGAPNVLRLGDAPVTRTAPKLQDSPFMMRAKVGELLVCAVVGFTSSSAFAARPPSTGQAEFLGSESGGAADGPTAGARFLAALPVSARETLRKEGRAMLDEKAKGNGMLRAVIRFERPIDEVFAVITEPSDQQRYLPNVDRSKTVGLRTEEGESVEMTVSVLFAVFKYRIQHWYYPEQHRMEWALDPSSKNDFVEQVGFFQLYELDEKTTIAEYGTRVVAKDGFVDFLRGLGERGGIADALTALRRHVHSPK
jgi:uncharacterized protein YndB with AHSA1/START domain